MAERLTSPAQHLWRYRTRFRSMARWQTDQLSRSSLWPLRFRSDYGVRSLTPPVCTPDIGQAVRTSLSLGSVSRSRQRCLHESAARV